MSASKYINHGKLGGTAACILAHGNHFGNTPMTLWEELTGRKDPEDLSWKLPVQIGIVTEDLNVDFLCHKSQYRRVPTNNPTKVADLLDKYPVKVHTVKTAAGNELLYVSEKHHWAVAQVDSLVTEDKNQNLRFVEAKHSSGFGSIEKSFETYYPQIQHYLGVLGLSHAALSVIYDNNRHEFMWVRADEKYIQKLWTKMEKFWSFVESDKPPIKISPTSKKVVPTKTKDLTKSNSWAVAEGDYLDNEAAAETFEAAKKTLKDLAPADCSSTFGKKLEIRRAKNGNASIKPIQKP